MSALIGLASLILLSSATEPILDHPADFASATTQSASAFSVHCFRIEIKPDQLVALRNDPRAYVPARLEADGETFAHVGIHLRGQTGSFRTIDDKAGFTVDFTRFESAQRWSGFQKVHLNNSVEDPTFAKEWIGSELFQSAGVPTPKVRHAQVFVNGRACGLYLLKEAFEPVFFARTLSQGDGAFYDLDAGHDVDQPMHRHVRGDPLDDSVARLNAALKDPDLHRRWLGAQEVLDMDEFLRFIAMEVIVCHWDGYSMARNNFRLYHDPRRNRLVFLPTGMDQIFSNPSLPWKPQMSGVTARALMETPEGQGAYEAVFRQLVADHLRPAQITNQIRQALISLPSLLSASQKAEFEEETRALCLRIVQREANLRQQLAIPETPFLAVPRAGVILANWHFHGSSQLEDPGDPDRVDGKKSLHLVARSMESGTWRMTVRLRQGRYRFEGLVKTDGIQPLAFGKNHGAGLHVRDRVWEGTHLLGTTDWKEVSADFQVASSDEEVELICDVRARAGGAWFAMDSLKLRLIE